VVAISYHTIVEYSACSYHTCKSGRGYLLVAGWVEGVFGLLLVRFLGRLVVCCVRDGNIVS